MRLYLVQHGEAKPKDQDPERSLTDQGRSDVGRLAAFLKGAGVSVSRVVHSGKLRARQTAEIMAQAIASGVRLEISDIINPLDPPDSLAKQIGDWNADTLVAGHLPFMSKLVALLITGDPEYAVASYQPGSVVCLERNTDGQWAVVWMLRPELFRK
jgi:phosphohistidine phosphatase